MVQLYLTQSSKTHVQHTPVHAQEQTTTFSTVKSGNWSDPSVWNRSQLPSATDSITISSGHNIVYDLPTTTISGIKIQHKGELKFSPTKTTTLQTTANFIVEGTLVMKPSSHSVIQTIRFINVDESKFVEGGMVPKDTDVGLWVMCTQDVVQGTGDPVPGMVMCAHTSPGGVLDIVGSTKTSWTRAAGSIAQGATQITLHTTPVGWQIGDEISIAPTENPSVGDPSWKGFDTGIITAISGDIVTINKPTTRPHPAVTNPFNTTIKYTAEVMNLTRNVRIEGTGNGESSISTNGRAHIFIRSTQPQNIKYVGIRYMGPRKPTGDTYLSNGQRVPIYQGLLGRYSVHFHHNMNASRGSIVEGVVARDIGNHAFVPHNSHGITMKDTISYNTFGDAYWWDSPPCDHQKQCGPNQTPDMHDSIDLTIDHAVAAMVRADPAFRGTRISGFNITKGVHNRLTLKNSVAVGVQGNVDASGFSWPEFGHSVWIFHDNIAHNNKIDGLFVWQNDSNPHIIERFVAYHNGEHGIDHGAYRNAYQYFDIDLIGNMHEGLNARAAAIHNNTTPRTDGHAQAFERIRMDTPLRIGEHNLPFCSATTCNWTLVKDCVIPGVFIDEDLNSSVHDEAEDRPGRYSFVNCRKPDGSSLEPTDFEVYQSHPDSTFRIQRPNGTAFQIKVNVDRTHTVSNISAFYNSLPTTTPTPSLKKGDADGNSVIDLLDYIRWKCEFFGNGTCKEGNNTYIKTADFNKDGNVDILDYSVWIIGFLSSF